MFVSILQKFSRKYVLFFDDGVFLVIIFPVEPLWLNWSAGKPEARYGVAISGCAVCNMVCVRWLCVSASRYCKCGKATATTLSILFSALPLFRYEFLQNRDPLENVKYSECFQGTQIRFCRKHQKFPLS